MFYLNNGGRFNKITEVQFVVARLKKKNATEQESKLAQKQNKMQLLKQILKKIKRDFICQVVSYT